jgi:hypothetical protein
VGRVVVHDQVQLLPAAVVGMGPGDLFEERQELLVPMPRLARRGHLPGGDLQCREQRRGAMPDIVVGAACAGMPACPDTRG